MKKSKFTFDQPKSIFIFSLVHLTISISLVLLLMSVSSLILLSSDSPFSYTGIFSFGIILISAVICSFIMSYITGMPAICSLISVLALSAILLSMSIFIKCENTSHPIMITTLYILNPILSYITSLISLKSKENKKPKFRTRNSYR